MKYPDLARFFKSDRPEWWSPSYKTMKGTQYSVPGTRSSECPVSCMDRSPMSHELVQLYLRSGSLQQQGVASYTGASLPIPLADAFVVLSGEQNKYDRARNDYESRDARQGGKE